MSQVRIELHLRRPSDLATLKPLHDALVAAGETPLLTRAPGLAASEPETSSGPVPCAVRVIVAGGGPAPDTEAERLVTVLDRVTPPLEPSDASELHAADLVLVPGERTAIPLRDRVAGEIALAGLPQLAPLRTDPEAARRAARESLGIPDGAVLVLYAPGAPADVHPGLEPSALARLAAAGWLIGILPSDPAEPRLEEYARFAARTAYALLLDAGAAGRAFAAADLLLSGDEHGLCAALALGCRAIGLGPDAMACDWPGLRLHAGDDPVALVRTALAAPADARVEGWIAERVTTAPDALVKTAERIRSLLPAPAPAPVAGAEASLFDEVEARVAFGDTAGGIAALEAHLASRPSARGYRLLASVQRRAAAPEAAERAARRAEQLARAELVQAICERARAWLDRGELERARECFEEASRLGTALADPWIGLGSLGLHRGEATAAELHFRAALERDPSARAWSGLGLALLAQSRPREALEPLEAALELDGDCLPAVYGMVKAAFDTGALEPAERRVSAFVERHPGNLDLAFTLAGLRHQLGDASGALELLERVELFDPAYPGVVELRAKLER